MTDDVGAELAIRAQPVLPMAPEQARQMMQAYQELTASIIGPEDRQRVDDKEFVKRSGFQKLAAAYGVSTEILFQNVETVTRDGETILVARSLVRATHPSGRHADGDGTCASNERRFRRGDQRMEHNLASTAATRAVNRAVSNLIAFGSVSAEEAEESATTTTRLPAWAAATNDIPGIAHNLTRVLTAAGVTGAAGETTRIGNEIFELCDRTFPVALAQLAALLATTIDTPEPVDATAEEETNTTTEDAA